MLSVLLSLTALASPIADWNTWGNHTSQEIAHALFTRTSTLNVCSSPSIFKISNPRFEPNPIKKGEDSMAIISGQSTETILPGAKCVIKIKFGFITVHTEEIPICKDGSRGILDCPAPPGEINASQSLKIPGAAPSGSYKGHISFINGDGREFACLDTDLYF